MPPLRGASQSDAPFDKKERPVLPRRSRIKPEMTTNRKARDDDK